MELEVVGLSVPRSARTGRVGDTSATATPVERSYCKGVGCQDIDRYVEKHKDRKTTIIPSNLQAMTLPNCIPE